MIKGLDEVFKKLRKDNFEKLSYDEQTEAIKDLIEIAENNSDEFNSKVFSVSDLGENDLKSIPLLEIIDNIGEENFIEAFRYAILDEKFMYESVSNNEVKRVLAKASTEDGRNNMTDIEKSILLSISQKMIQNDKKDVSFSTYALIESILSFIGIEENSTNDDVHFLGHIEVEANLLYIMAIACVLIDDNNAFSKTFNKHGFKKAHALECDITSRLSKIIIEFFKENDIDPSASIIALAHIMKTISSTLPLTLDDLDKDTAEQHLTKVFETLSGIDSASESYIKDFLNGNNEKQKGSNNARQSDISPNGDNKDMEKKKLSNRDIRSLLLDD